jgi:putative copper export protein
MRDGDGAGGMEEATRIPTIVREIELSLTPVFVLTALGALLAFAGARLDRILDDPDSGAARRRLIRWAIGCFTVAAILVCGIVCLIFVQDYVPPNLTLPIAGLFIATMALIAAGLVCALREIGLEASRARARRATGRP